MSPDEILVRSREAMAKWCEHDGDSDGAAKYRSGRGDDCWDMEILGIALGDVGKPIADVISADPDMAEAKALVAARWPEGCVASGQGPVVDYCLAAIKRGRELERVDRQTPEQSS